MHDPDVAAAIELDLEGRIKAHADWLNGTFPVIGQRPSFADLGSDLLSLLDTLRSQAEEIERLKGERDEARKHLNSEYRARMASKSALSELCGIIIAAFPSLADQPPLIRARRALLTLETPKAEDACG